MLLIFLTGTKANYLLHYNKTTDKSLFTLGKLE